MEGDASGRGDGSVHFEQPIPNRLPLVGKNFRRILRVQFSKYRPCQRMGGRQFVLEYDFFTSDVLGPMVQQDAEKGVIRLTLNGGRLAGQEKAVEQIEYQGAEPGQDEEFEGRPGSGP